MSVACAGRLWWRRRDSSGIHAERLIAGSGSSKESKNLDSSFSSWMNSGASYCERMTQSGAGQGHIRHADRPTAETYRISREVLGMLTPQAWAKLGVVSILKGLQVRN